MSVEYKLLELNGRLIRWIKGQRFPPGFDEWCELAGPYSVKFEQPPTLGTVETAYTGADAHFIVKALIREVTEESRHWTTLGLNLEGRYANGDWIFHFPMSKERNPPMGAENTNALQVHFSASLFSGELQFINLRTPLLSFVNFKRTKHPIRLVNCVIGKMVFPNLYEQRDRGELHIQLQDCWIGTMKLHSKSLNNLTVIGGGIAQIECPSSDSENPFTGHVSFKKVFFPTCPQHTKLFRDSHAYGSLHAHLKHIDNTLMANLMRRHQLRAERADEHDRFGKFSNWIYGTFANYGVSLGRPLLWLLGIFLLTVIYLYNFDCGTLTKPDNFYKGANDILLDKNGGRFFRSVLLPVHSIINPFGIFFDARKLIVPTTLLTTVLLTIQGLLSDMLLVMTALSVRRRFKAE